MPTELVWLIFTFAAASGKSAALHVSLVCREARRIALPYALSMFSRWSGRHSFQIDCNPKLRAFRLPPIRHLSLYLTRLEDAGYDHIVTNCRHLSDMCIDESHLNRLSLALIQRSAINGVSFNNNLLLTLRRFPRNLMGLPLPVSSLHNAVTRLILPGMWDDDYIYLPLLLGLLPNLTHLALSVSSTRFPLSISVMYHDPALLITRIEAHIDKLVRLVSDMSLQMVVTMLHRERWTLVQGGLVHHSLRAYERLHKLAATKDEHIHFVLVDHNTMDEEAIHERWEAEAWGSETIWEKAARLRRRIRRKALTSPSSR